MDYREEVSDYEEEIEFKKGLMEELEYYINKNKDILTEDGENKLRTYISDIDEYELDMEFMIKFKVDLIDYLYTFIENTIMEDDVYDRYVKFILKVEKN